MDIDIPPLVQAAGGLCGIGFIVVWVVCLMRLWRLRDCLHIQRVRLQADLRSPISSVLYRALGRGLLLVGSRVEGSGGRREAGGHIVNKRPRRAVDGDNVRLLQKGPTADSVVRPSDQRRRVTATDTTAPCDRPQP